MEMLINNLSLVALLYFLHFIINYKDTFSYLSNLYDKIINNDIDVDEQFWESHSFNIKYILVIELWILVGVIFAYNIAFLFMLLYAIFKIIYDFMVYKYKISYSSFFISNYIYHVSMGLMVLYIYIEYSNLWNIL